MPALLFLEKRGCTKKEERTCTFRKFKRIAYESFILITRVDLFNDLHDWYGRSICRH